jgi:hypothetical protein
MRKIKKAGILRQYTRTRKMIETREYFSPDNLPERITESKEANKDTNAEKEKLAMRLKFYKTGGLALPL